MIFSSDQTTRATQLSTVVATYYAALDTSRSTPAHVVDYLVALILRGPWYVAEPNDRQVVQSAVLSLMKKGDGFVWMKRKHYFEGDKNPHFLTNYSR